MGECPLDCLKICFCLFCPAQGYHLNQSSPMPRLRHDLLKASMQSMSQVPSNRRYSRERDNRVQPCSSPPRIVERYADRQPTASITRELLSPFRVFSNFGRMALICHEPAVCVPFSPRRCLHASQHEHRGGSNGSPQTPGLFLPRIFPQTCAMGPATGASPGGFCPDPPDPGLPAHPGQFLVIPERTSPPTGRAVERALDTSFCRTGC